MITRADLLTLPIPAANAAGWVNEFARRPDETPSPAQLSPNWIEIEAGRQLRARLRQRVEWLRALGRTPSTERLAAEFDRSPSTITRHMRMPA